MRKNYCREDIFLCIDKMPWADSVPRKVIEKKAAEAVKVLTEGEPARVPILYRLVGQSGSGKTSQLLPAILEAERRRGNTPVVVAVRKFAELHPDFAEFKGKPEMRERTNGFALRCLTVALKLLVETGYMIALDMTLLEPCYEEYLYALLKRCGYRVNYQIMAVNPSVSSLFIMKRAESSANECEGGRVVARESASYFNSVLLKGLKYISRADKDAVCTVWSAFGKTPLYIGTLSGVWEPFAEGRDIHGALEIPEEELLRAKVERLCESAD